VTQEELSDALPKLVHDFVRVQRAEDVSEVVRLIEANPNITWEMIPTKFLGEAKVWEVLLPNLPMTALLRNLARMTANGVLKPLSRTTQFVADRLTDEERIRKARIHPVAILAALATYRQGHGTRGRLSWEPVPEVIDALNSAFYLAFRNVPATGKRWLLALDVSGSMSAGSIAGIPGLTPCMASAAMAMVTARVEPHHHIMGFAHEFRPLGITAEDSLEEAMEKAHDSNFGGTDCALPMLWALENGVEVDVFVVYTDSETWYGDIHPAQALQKYRREMGIPAKLVVVGMVSNGFTIADPDDAGMLDVVGFDTATPNLIADFATDVL